MYEVYKCAEYIFQYANLKIGWSREPWITALRVTSPFKSKTE